MITTINKLEQLATQGNNVSDLFYKAMNINANRIDMNVKMGDMYFHDDATISIGGSGNYHFTEYALSQDCAKIKVPVTYIKTCYNGGMGELASDNMNKWTSIHGNKKVLLRSYGNVIRGVLSDRYSKLDSEEILEVLNHNQISNRFNVVGSYLSADRLHLRMISPEPLKVDGEDLFTGIQIDNSDVGMASLSVTLFIYKQVCTNGLVLPKDKGVLFKRKHIGIDSVDFKSQLIDGISNLENYNGSVTSIIEETRKNKMSILELGNRLDRIKLETNMGDENIDFMRELMLHKYGTNSWGLINALTEVAQRYTLDRRLDIEKYASKLLVM